jgi:hypothetical protein
MVVPHQIMKQLARKSRHISLVPPTAEQEDRQDAAPSLQEFFDGWLSTVSTTLTTPDRTKHRSSKAVFENRPLTSTDVTRVNRATVRESIDHRHWPPGVVQTFMLADVIKRNRGK